MDRAAALNYLTEEYRELATNAKFTTQQTTDAYNTAIDMALRQLSVAETDLSTYDVAQADTLKYLALLNYYALSRFARLLSIQFDVKAGQGAIEASRSQAFKAVMQLKDEAAKELLQYGVKVGASSGAGMQFGRLNLGFLEPPCADEFAGGWI